MLKQLQRSGLLFGIFAGLLVNYFHTKIAFAQDANSQSIVETPRQIVADELQGKKLYEVGQISEAIDSWQQALQAYQNQENKLAQARVLGNLCLAYQQLGKWQSAKQAIAESLNILQSPSKLERSIAKERILAQALNNQGALYLAMGQSSLALETWQDAEKAYNRIHDVQGVFRSRINQASALQALGFYRKAWKMLTQVDRSWQKQPNSLLKATGLRSLGNVLALIGESVTAEKVLHNSLKIAQTFESDKDVAETWLALGNLAQAKGADLKALSYYQQGLDTCTNQLVCTSTIFQIQLARSTSLLRLKRFAAGEKLLEQIDRDHQNLAINHTNIYNQIYLARTLVNLRQKSQQNNYTLSTNLSSWQSIAVVLNRSIEQAQQLKDIRALAYATGSLAEVYELQQQWSIAQQLTEKALLLAQTINATEISYLYQWQLGRIFIAQNRREQAIVAYREAIHSLKSLNNDLVAVNQNIQFSFQESVEPVYRQLVSLLLKKDDLGKVSQENLVEARDTIELLQLAELHDFFREACVDVTPVQIDRLDKEAAVIYPIILRNRLEVILSLPGKPLRHYTTVIADTELENVVERMRQTLVIRSRRDFFAPAQKIYHWLIHPALSDLAQSQVKTLVFVLDGSLRNIPMAALYDGKHYLIEQYNVAIAPGLNLLSPRPWQQVNLNTLAVGVAKARHGFSSLDNVPRELATIQKQVPGKVMLDRDFTKEAFQEEIEFSNFPIVHIATHGQFSSKLADTFLLAWDSQINIDQLDRILRGRNSAQNKAIELLVLSACETATGDKRAALGLAGIAVRAGTRSTLATLWSVNDRATSELMSKFYAELAKQQIHKAEAVRAAQLRLLRDPAYKHPFYWSAFVLVGNWL